MAGVPDIWQSNQNLCFLAFVASCLLDSSLLIFDLHMKRLPSWLLQVMLGNSRMPFKSVFLFRLAVRQIGGGEDLSRIIQTYCCGNSGFPASKHIQEWKVICLSLLAWIIYDSPGATLWTRHSGLK